jgi:lysophospholipase L1-like esterase
MMAKLRPILHVLTVVGITIGVTITAAILDRLYGRWLMPETRDIVFPAYSTFRHHSSEFDLTVKVNNLGFRGPNTTLQNKGRRVAVMGDSFTFGWGVEDDETWVHLLGEAFPDVELLNLGRGGTHPGDHVQLARRALPLLNPDVVIVAVLQGNDIGQLRRIIAHERGLLQPRFPHFHREKNGNRFIRQLRERLFPNLSRRLPGVAFPTEVWKQEAETIIVSFSEQEMTRYDGLNPSLKKDFKAGLVNPSIILEAITEPEAPCLAVDMGDTLTRDAAIRLRDHLSELKKLCTENDVQLILWGFPTAHTAVQTAFPTCRPSATASCPAILPMATCRCVGQQGARGFHSLRFHNRFHFQQATFIPWMGTGTEWETVNSPQCSASTCNPNPHGISYRPLAIFERAQEMVAHAHHHHAGTAWHAAGDGRRNGCCSVRLHAFLRERKRGRPLRRKGNRGRFWIVRAMLLPRAGKISPFTSWKSPCRTVPKSLSSERSGQ